MHNGFDFPQFHFRFGIDLQETIKARCQVPFPETSFSNANFIDVVTRVGSNASLPLIMLIYFLASHVSTQCAKA